MKDYSVEMLRKISLEWKESNMKHDTLSNAMERNGWNEFKLKDFWRGIFQEHKKPNKYSKSDQNPILKKLTCSHVLIVIIVRASKLQQKTNNNHLTHEITSTSIFIIVAKSFNFRLSNVKPNQVTFTINELFAPSKRQLTNRTLTKKPTQIEIVKLLWLITIISWIICIKFLVSGKFSNEH